MFLRGHDLLMAMNNHKISGNSVIGLVIVLLFNITLFILHTHK